MFPFPLFWWAWKAYLFVRKNKASREMVVARLKLYVQCLLLNKRDLVHILLCCDSVAHLNKLECSTDTQCNLSMPVTLTLHDSVDASLPRVGQNCPA